MCFAFNPSASLSISLFFFSNYVLLSLYLLVFLSLFQTKKIILCNQGPFGGLIHANHENGVDSPFKRPADGGGYGGGMMPVNNNSFGLATAGNPLPGLAPPPPPGMEDHLSKFDIEVNESLVGAVLGPAGRSIVEIQQFSGILPSYVIDADESELSCHSHSHSHSLCIYKYIYFPEYTGRKSQKSLYIVTSDTQLSDPV